MDDTISDRRRKRRKQPYPLHIIQDPLVLTEALERGAREEYGDMTLRSFDNHVCGRCCQEFFTMSAFIVHKKSCTNEWPVFYSHGLTDRSIDMRIDTTDSEGGEQHGMEEMANIEETEALDLCVNSAKDTVVADSAPDECTIFPSSLSPDGVMQIQSALRSLQGQQLMQMQLIKQIYSQLVNTNAGPNSTDQQNSNSIGFSRSSLSDFPVIRSIDAIDFTNTRRFSNLACGILSPPNSGSETSPEDRRLSHFDAQSETSKSADISAFDALKSQVINSLKEMEQSVAQQIREQRKADTYLDKLYRHRCHFCGKIMTSESSLQIHIRSHTGERPYACPSCDSRFSTKGNLKVHMDVHRGEESHINRVGQFGIEDAPGTSSKSQNTVSDNDTVLSGEAIGESRCPQSIRRDDAQAFAKNRSRSISLPCLTASTGKILFLDDTTIDYSHSTVKIDECDRRQGDSIEMEPMTADDARDSYSNQSAIAESGTTAIDLRLNVTNTKTTSLPVQSYPSNPFPSFPSLAGLYPGLLSAASTSIPSVGDSSQGTPKTVTHPTSSLFAHPQHYDFLKLNVLENGNTNSLSISRPTQPLSLSPSTCADLEEDWESMMEITTTDEAEKIKSLVGDRETKVTDPNQCLICHRILSCKSALQMHYRTHTGERPFKCKICSRAFTTKGNLKTHMGVHRAKPPFRLFHQCPICHKKFNNSVILQQHIRLHAGHAPDLPLQRSRTNEIKDENKAKDAVLDFGRPYNLTPQQPPSVHSTLSILSTPAATVSESPAKRPPSTLISPKVIDRTLPSSANSSTLPSSSKSQSPFLEESANQENKYPAFTPFSSPPLDLFRNQAGAAAAFTSWLSRFGQSPFPLVSFAPSSISSTNSIVASVSQSPGTANRSMHLPPSLTLPQTNPFDPVILPNPPPTPMFGRPNTTCNICFKTFACNSALEIHYRSHTKERPFKCTVCGRGFSTKGNMKQHLLTHKIRDAVTSDTVSSNSSNQDSHSNPASSSAGVTPQQDQQRQNAYDTTTPIHSGDEDSLRGTSANYDKSNNGPPALKRETSPTSEHQSENEKFNAEDDSKQRSEVNDGLTPLESIKSMWARTESLATTCPSPGTKRPPVLSKHQCQVCYKHFSSSSALAIHMRTHTGERPFCCPACGRSFTTKGNLKVHMGTHSWQHAQSRRGRRIFDSQPGQTFGSVDLQHAFGTGDRSSAASLEEISNASNPNSDADQGNGPCAPSPAANGRNDGSSAPGPRNGASGERKSAAHNSHTSTPSHSDIGSSAPNAIGLSNLISSTSSHLSPAISSSVLSKGNLRNGTIGSFFTTPSSVFPNSISPSSSFAFMNSFPMGSSIPYSSPSFTTANVFPTPSYGDGHGGGAMQTMLWMWRNVCSVCRHVCSSVTELEDHLKLHLVNAENGNDKMATTGIST